MPRNNYTECYDAPLGCGGLGCVYCKIDKDEKSWMANVTPHAVYIKGRAFFVEQGGDKKEWGKNWKEVEGRSIAEAWRIARDRWQPEVIRKDMEKRYGTGS